MELKFYFMVRYGVEVSDRYFQSGSGYVYRQEQIVQFCCRKIHSGTLHFLPYGYRGYGVTIVRGDEVQMECVIFIHSGYSGVVQICIAFPFEVCGRVHVMVKTPLGDSPIVGKSDGTPFQEYHHRGVRLGIPFYLNIDTDIVF